MHGRTTWKNKWRKDGTRIGTKYYVCGAAITKGKTVCQPIQFLQRVLDDYVLDFVAQRIDALLGARGRDALRALIERQLAPSGPDPAPEKKPPQGAPEGTHDEDRLGDRPDGHRHG